MGNRNEEETKLQVDRRQQDATGDDDDDDSQTKTPSFLSASLRELSSCSQESPTKCRVLEDPYPRHALLIHEWLLNEHDGLLKIYDILAEMRDMIRKKIISEGYQNSGLATV